MIDLTSFFEALAALAAALLTAFVIPWLRNRTTDQQRESLRTWAEIAVAAAEQLYRSNQGQEKKNYVLSFLEGRGYRMDDEAVHLAVEAAVLALHKGLGGGERT